MTHLHYDHAGTLYDFPEARFHLQELEMQYATGPHMAQRFFSGAYTVNHVVEVVRNVFEGRVVFHDGDDEIAPGVSVHYIGGHTMGIQCVRVKTRKGWVVLASDVSHFYENYQARSPFPIVYNVADMLKGFERLETLAEKGGIEAAFRAMTQHSHHEGVQANGCFMMYMMVDCESVRPAIREGKAVMDAARNNFPNNARIKQFLKDVYANI